MSNVIELICPICNKTFFRSDKEYKRNVKNNQTPVCSRICSNKLTYRRRMKPKGICIACGSPCRLQAREKFCKCFSCKQLSKKPSKTFDNFDWNCIKLEDLELESKINGSSGSIHSKIRSHSRWTYKKSNRLMKCNKCGYDIHVEICHIKPVKEFGKTSILGEVNHIDNLIALCRNCHWELDHGLWFIPHDSSNP